MIIFYFFKFLAPQPRLEDLWMDSADSQRLRLQVFFSCMSSTRLLEEGVLKAYQTTTSCFAASCITCCWRLLNPPWDHLTWMPSYHRPSVCRDTAHHRWESWRYAFWSINVYLSIFLNPIFLFLNMQIISTKCKCIVKIWGIPPSMLVNCNDSRNVGTWFGRCCFYFLLQPSCLQVFI